MACPEHQERREYLEITVGMVHQAELGPLDHQVLTGLKESLETLEPLVSLELTGPMEGRGPEDRTACLDLME